MGQDVPSYHMIKLGLRVNAAILLVVKIAN